MTVSTELPDPGQVYLDSLDVTNVLDDPLGAIDDVQSVSTRASTIAAVALSLGAAFLVIRALMGSQLAAQGVPEGDPYNVAKDMWTKFAPLWLRMTVPAVTHAFALGNVDLAAMTPGEVQAMATAYAESLGEHINDTSAEALAQGFNAQLAGGWNERLAWQRASVAYGLDKEQMKSFASAKVGRSAYAGDPVDDATRLGVDRALTIRADRLGGNEAHAAVQMGRTVAWMAAAARGEIDPSSTKVWATAQDELVCPTCGPMDTQERKLHQQFETPAGVKLWAPGVHPNCRCEVNLRIVYPDADYVEKALGDDPYDRDRTGRFARDELRSAARERVKARNRARGAVRVAPVAEPVPQDPEIAAMLEQALAAQTIDPFAPERRIPDPFANYVDPFATKIDPFATRPDPFAAAKVDPFARSDPFATRVDPFVDPKPGKRRVVVLIEGKKTPVDIPDVPEDVDPPDDDLVVAGASAYREFVEDEYEGIHHGKEFKPGDVIDFDLWGQRINERSRKVSSAQPDVPPYAGTAMSNIPGAMGSLTRLISSESSAMIGASEDSQEDLSDNYYEAVNELYERAMRRSPELVDSMRGTDLDSIFLDSGMPADQLSLLADGIKRERLIQGIDDGDYLAEAFYEWVRETQPAMLGETNFATMADVLEETGAGAGSRVMEVFVFPEGFKGSYLDHGAPRTPLLGEEGAGGFRTPLIEGKYRVKAVRVRDSHTAFGSDAASVATHFFPSWREVELVPIGSE